MPLKWQCLDMNRTEPPKIWLRLSDAKIAYITIMNRTAKGITAIEFIGQEDLIGFVLTEKGGDVG